MHDIRARRDDLRRRRVELRKAIQRQQQLLVMRSGDPIDGQQRLVHLQMQLRGTEREWAELSALLGEPASRPPVKLAVTPRAQPVQLRCTATRSARPGYWTKDMRST